MERQAVNFHFNFSGRRLEGEWLSDISVWTSGNQVKTEIADYNSPVKIK